MNVIALDCLRKRYGNVVALDGTSWALQRGQLLGFLGPNGAGKTTTIRILLGFLRATSGRAAIFGLDVRRNSTAIRRRLGYLAGDVHLYLQLTGHQTIRFVAQTRGMGDAGDAPRLAELLELNLAVRVRTYSKGMRQKLGLILAMMHRPELLILDEPTSALDPLMQQVLYRELRAAVADGRTVLFSSHSLSEVQALCEGVVILRAGKVVASTDISTLRRSAAQRVRVRLTDSAAAASLAADADRLPAGFSIRQHHRATLDAYWRGEPKILLTRLAEWPLAEVIIEPPDLEDLFFAYYETDSTTRSEHRP